MSKDLVALTKSGMVNSAGELKINAGKYARGAILMAYEMMGGLDALVEWGEENKGDFYTKLFTKVVGREVEHTASDSVEALLDRLDSGEFKNITTIDAAPIEEAEFEDIIEPPKPSSRTLLKRMADVYADGEEEYA